MFAIARFEVKQAESRAFAAQCVLALDALKACDGFIDGEFGQNLDDVNLWSITTIWVNVGSYRRALGKNEVKLCAIPLLALAIDEPGAYSVD